MRCPNKPDMVITEKETRDAEAKFCGIVQNKMPKQTRHGNYRTHANGRIGQFDGTKERIQGLCPSR